MKKAIKSFLLVAVMCTALAVGSAFAEEQPISVYVDGDRLEFDVDPVVENGRTLVPMRGIFEALGAQVSWDGETSTASAQKGDTVIKITIDSNKMMKNDQVIELDVPARAINSRTLVPVRAVSEGMDARVEWNGETRSVIITTVQMAESDTLPFDTLSDEDKKTLGSIYGSLRYNFEQNSLPDAVFDESMGVAQAIKTLDPYMQNVADGIWNGLFIGGALYVQITSVNSTYELSYTEEGIAQGMDEDTFLEGYMKILQENGLDAQSIFECTYVSVNDGTNIFIISFNDTDSLLACKYIGVAVNKEGELHYYTAETGPFSGDELFFCEVTVNARGTIGILENTDEDTFCGAIDSVINGD